MNPAYAATLEYLYAQLPMFSRLGKAAIKADLTNTIALCAALDNPQDHFPCIHIAGTNGKGSTSHMLAAVLQAAGYRTGLYTSPHLVDFRERIRIDGAPVAKQWVTDFVAEHKAVIENIQPSFFEITVAMAFAAFSEMKVDVAVIETGLGGRLDSTNIIRPVLSVITNIGLDHTDLLGDTLEAIAREKGGIIKPGVPVVVGAEQPETGRVFSEAALRNGSQLIYAPRRWALARVGQDVAGQSFKAVSPGTGAVLNLRTDLAGKYQQHNIATVLTAADALGTAGWRVSAESALPALERVRETTGLRGRWEVLRQTPLVIADVAHNADGLTEVLAQWQQTEAQEKHVLLGFVRDKDVDAALAKFPKHAHYHFCNASIPRALLVDELTARASAAGLTGTAYASVAAALSGAMGALGPDDALLITGSFFVVGEALEAGEAAGYFIP